MHVLETLLLKALKIILYPTIYIYATNFIIKITKLSSEASLSLFVYSKIEHLRTHEKVYVGQF